MMRTHRLSLATLSLLGLLMPMSAVAYVSPDDILLQDSLLNNFTAPPTARETENVAASQRETSAERRAREQAEYFAAQRGGTEDEYLYGAAPAQSGSDDELTDVLADLRDTIAGLKDEQDSIESRRQQRLLDRIEENQESYHSGAPLDGKGGCVPSGKGTDGKGMDGKGGCVINSGAPLNESGPGTWFAIGFVCLALWATLRKAAKMTATAAARA
jgi:hypothetical protein